MKKRGFTLIELLAVIVILAIIALIATPAVLNIIEDSRKGAAEASARNILNSAKTYYMQEKMNGRTPDSIDLSTNTLKYDGDQATKGTITFEDGKASGKMYVGGYCVEVAVNGKVTSEKKAEDECIVGEENGGSGVVTPEPEPDPTPVYRKYDDGDALLYNPVDNVKCDTESGNCMKWYAFLDSENNEKVKLILDHNTTNAVGWNVNKGTTADTVNAKLVDDVSGWDDTVKSTARLISAQEISQIAPRKDGTNFDVNNQNTKYFLHDGTTTKYTGAAGTNNYAWLLDGISGCTSIGCNETGSTFGYWTSSFAYYSAGTYYAWIVYYEGNLEWLDVTGTAFAGVRPVIEVSKSIFE